MTTSTIRTREYNGRQWVLPARQGKSPDNSCAKRDGVVRVLSCGCAAAQPVVVYSCEEHDQCVDTPLSKDVLAELGLHRHANCRSCQDYVKQSQAVDVAVICHNYQRFLPECLASIRRQTIPARNVFVLDPASDEPVEGAIRLESKCIWNAKREAVALMASPFGLIVDADNWLGPTFLEDSLRAIGDTSFAYPDKYHFGQSDRVDRMSEFDSSVTNMADTCSLFRVADWRIARPAEGSPQPSEWEDHTIWRNMQKAGFSGVPSGAKLHYRKHGDSMSSKWVVSYYDNMALNKERVDVVIPLSGRGWAWEDQLGWLKKQPNVRPVLIFTSGDMKFRSAVLDSMRDFDHSAISIDVGFRPGLADLPRMQYEREVQIAMCRIWNTAQCLVNSDFVLTLEDDILPPIDAVELLMRSLDVTVGAVAAPYLQRHAPHYTHWYGPFSFSNMAKDRREGVEEISGSGFGCTLFRKGMLLAHPFSMPPGARYYDPAWFAKNSKWRCLVNWSAECLHRQGPTK